MLDALLAFDHAVFRAINGLQGTPAVDSFFLWCTELGTAWFGAIPIAVLFLLRHRKEWRSLVMGTIWGLLLGALNMGIKLLVARPRPPAALPDTKVIGPILTMSSFPSGHTLLAFIVLALLLRMDRTLALAWLPLALLIAFSRMYLGVHFPSDVLVGGVLGFVPTYYLSRYLPARTPA